MHNSKAPPLDFRIPDFDLKPAQILENVPCIGEIANRYWPNRQPADYSGQDKPVYDLANTGRRL